MLLYNIHMWQKGRLFVWKLKVFFDGRYKLGLLKIARNEYFFFSSFEDRICLPLCNLSCISNGSFGMCEKWNRKRRPWCRSNCSTRFKLKSDESEGKYIWLYTNVHLVSCFIFSSSVICNKWSFHRKSFHIHDRTFPIQFKSSLTSVHRQVKCTYFAYINVTFTLNLNILRRQIIPNTSPKKCMWEWEQWGFTIVQEECLHFIILIVRNYLTCPRPQRWAGFTCKKHLHDGMKM